MLLASAIASCLSGCAPGQMFQTGGAPRTVEARPGAGGSGPYRVVLRDLPTASAGSRAIDDDAEQHRPVNLDAARWGLQPRVVRGREVSVSEGKVALRPLRRLTPKDATFGATLNRDGEIDVTGANNGSEIMTISDAGFVDVVSASGLVKRVSQHDFYCSSGLPACSGPGQGAVDDRITYDPGSQRWIVTAMYLSAGTGRTPVIIAVSQTSDPTGAYNLYQFSACGPNHVGDTDQPHTGFNANWIVVDAACQSSEPSLTVFDKNNLYNGGSLTASTYWQFVDPVSSGGNNHDNPVLTYGTPVDGREYLTASAIVAGSAAVVYSYVDGTVDAPTFTAGFTQVDTSFAATGPVPVDAPGCSGCINTFSNGVIHSSTVSGPWLLSTMMLGDPRFARSTQAVQVAYNLQTSTVTSQQFAGGVAGAGILASEIAMQAVPNTTFNSAILAYGRSRSDYFPGVRIAQWNIDTNAMTYVNEVQQGTKLPSAANQNRWLDFMGAISPVPNGSSMVASGPVATASPSDPDRSDVWALFLP